MLLSLSLLSRNFVSHLTLIRLTHNFTYSHQSGIHIYIYNVFLVQLAYGMKCKSNWSKTTNYFSNWLKRFTKKKVLCVHWQIGGFLLFICLLFFVLLMLLLILEVVYVRKSWIFARSCCKWNSFVAVKKCPNNKKATTHTHKQTNKQTRKQNPDQLSLLSLIQ